MQDTKLSLKLLIDKKAKRILFAEAGKEFVDFLFSLLSLPLGTVVTKASMVGCVGNLYQSLENLNEAYMQSNKDKGLLLNPSMPNHVTMVPLLLPDIKLHSSERKFYCCPNDRNDCFGFHGGHGSLCYVTDHLNITCPHCKIPMSQIVEFIEGSNVSATNSTGGGGYVKDLVSYMVTDDLSVSPMSLISSVSLLNKFNVMNFGALEERMVEFGISEGLELLKASLQSKAALTTVFLVKQGAKVDAASN